MKLTQNHHSTVSNVHGFNVGLGCTILRRQIGLVLLLCQSKLFENYLWTEGTQGDIAFVSTGYHNWKAAADSRKGFAKHEHSTYHLTAIQVLSTLESYYQMLIGLKKTQIGKCFYMFYPL